MRPPESWSRARATLVITLATAAAWFLAWGLGRSNEAAQFAGFIPADVMHDLGRLRVPLWLTPLTATLVHAHFFHVAFNLLVFSFCGRTTENVLGPTGLVLLYVLGAYAAAAAHYALQPSDSVPMVGASGAISAVIGAYSILFGRNKVKATNPRIALWLNALWLMAAWVILNVIVGFAFANLSGGDIQVAAGAHIGGFLVGVALAYPLLLFRYRKA